MQEKTYRQDYQKPKFVAPQIELIFKLDHDITEITCRTQYKKSNLKQSENLVLNGVNLNFKSISLNGKTLRPAQYQIDNEELVVFSPPDDFELCIKNTVSPSSNTYLSGLFSSQNDLFTQCEAQGFRRITYFQDRPDVLTTFTVTLIGDKLKFPILLSNGNLVEKGDSDANTHFTKWHDPFPKPCYLFAVVAGNFAVNEKHIKRADGRPALLQIYANKNDISQTQYALEALHRAIQWDYKRFGLDLDLDRFMIVAAPHFNMGAMENKGLNIFNSKYVLASPETATDMDFHYVESVIGHEYFHNWTGNRVTCRDWFQLTLKEGLTVFRDQEFSAYCNAKDAVIKRIDDVKTLRQHQFTEDAGPMAHPIRPDSYLEIDNFYTATIYEKGAEVVRMLQTILGKTTFSKGLQLYLEQFDGQAATCENFIESMQVVSGKDLSQFMRWYYQVGTPEIQMQHEYDSETRTLSITFTQQSRSELPLHIPLICGLLDKNGKDVLPIEKQLFELTQRSQTFVVENVQSPVVISALRGFSAPVLLQSSQQDSDLLHLATYDPDLFNRWEATQKFWSLHIIAAYCEYEKNDIRPTPLTSDAIYFWQKLLSDSKNLVTDTSKMHNQSSTVGSGYLSLLMTLPTFENLSTTLCNQKKLVDPQRLVNLIRATHQQIADQLEREWENLYDQTHSALEKNTYQVQDHGLRRLKNLALHYLSHSKTKSALECAKAQYLGTNGDQNMTDRYESLHSLLQIWAPQHPFVAELLLDFSERYSNNPLVIDKWFAVQASSPNTTVEHISNLIGHPLFNRKNPNRIRSLLHTFCHTNPAGFHQKDGRGYLLWRAELNKLEKLNPQIAARLARAIEHWKKYTSPYQNLMEQQLKLAYQEIKNKEVLEIISISIHQ